MVLLGHRIHPQAVGGLRLHHHRALGTQADALFAGGAGARVVRGDLQAIEPGQCRFDFVGIKAGCRQFAPQLARFRAGIALPIIFVNVNKHFKHAPNITQLNARANRAHAWRQGPIQPAEGWLEPCLNPALTAAPSPPDGQDDPAGARSKSPLQPRIRPGPHAQNSRLAGAPPPPGVRVRATAPAARWWASRCGPARRPGWRHQSPSP